MSYSLWDLSVSGFKQLYIVSTNEDAFLFVFAITQHRGLWQWSTVRPYGTKRSRMRIWCSFHSLFTSFLSLHLSPITMWITYCAGHGLLLFNSPIDVFLRLVWPWWYSRSVPSSCPRAGTYIHTNVCINLGLCKLSINSKNINIWVFCTNALPLISIRNLSEGNRQLIHTKRHAYIHIYLIHIPYLQIHTY